MGEQGKLEEKKKQQQLRHSLGRWEKERYVLEGGRHRYDRADKSRILGRR
jgi:hypothetical protein